MSQRDEAQPCYRKVAYSKPEWFLHCCTTGKRKFNHIIFRLRENLFRLRYIAVFRSSSELPVLVAQYSSITSTQLDREIVKGHFKKNSNQTIVKLEHTMIGAMNSVPTHSITLPIIFLKLVVEMYRAVSTGNYVVLCCCLRCSMNYVCCLFYVQQRKLPQRSTELIFAERF